MFLHRFYGFIDLVYIIYCGFHCVARNLEGNDNVRGTCTVDTPLLILKEEINVQFIAM